MSRKKILCLDFDGVLHSYTSGWKGADVIPDPPVPGAIKFLIHATRVFDVCVFSSRSHQEGGIEAMRKWLLLHGGEDLVARLRFPTEKSPAHVSIDDRALTFTGEWPLISEIDDFKPWNKQSREKAPFGPPVGDLQRGGEGPGAWDFPGPGVLPESPQPAGVLSAGSAKEDPQCNSCGSVGVASDLVGVDECPTDGQGCFYLPTAALLEDVSVLKAALIQAKMKNAD